MSDPLPTPSAAELQAAWRDGGQALRDGRHADALARFQQIIDAGQANTAVWIGVAMARRATDRAAERAALAEALKLEPRDLRALLMTADSYVASGDKRAADAYYDAFLKLTKATGDTAMRAEAPRAQRMRDEFSAGYSEHMNLAIAAHPLDRPEGRRMRRALDLMLGKTELFVQQPRYFYFPELPNIQYAERDQFPWLARVEAATDDIRAELLKVLEEDSAVSPAGFTPYLEPEPNRPLFNPNGMVGNPDWSAFYLWKAGKPVPENMARCPSVMAALAEAPLCQIPGRTPSVHFSLLRPGAHIAPHHGFMNARYVCHLPLIVPEGCAMRVGSDTRAWVEGRACVFDDSIEHEAWNRNPDRLRVVLIFDIWRPELSAEERDFISSVIQAVDTYGGAPALD
ncbi:MAG: aspartyl/asparaginyl beta-hydroxylase domain-containing protein [Phenylobacterium sp.]